MTRISRLLLAFSLIYGLFMVVPAFLDQPAPGALLLKRGDLVDLLTPAILLPLYGLLYLATDKRPLARHEWILFVVIAALWAEGQGMHLASNSIGHYFVGMDSDASKLAHLYDETISHYIWHGAVLAMSVLIIARAWRAPENDERIQWVPVIFAAAVYGFTCFLIFVEGTTATLAIPVMAAVAIVVLARRRHNFAACPMLAFFAVAYMVALVFCAVWAIYWGGLPEFSEVGII